MGFGNKKIIQKLVDEDGPTSAPNSKKLRRSTITVIDSDGNEVQKSIFIDDQSNIVNEDDIDYIEESYIDELGDKKTRKSPKIKDESFNRMKKDAIEEQKRYSTIPVHKVLKEIVEIDEFGDERIVQKLVDKDGPTSAPNSKKLRKSTITVNDPDGNEIQKSIFIDDQSNIVNEDDIDYIEESYIDELGDKKTRKSPKIKDESFNRMKKDAMEEQKKI